MTTQVEANIEEPAAYLPPLRLSHTAERMYAMLYLLEVRYEQAWLKEILVDLGMPIDANTDVRQRYYMYFKRAVTKLENDWYVRVEYENVTTYDKELNEQQRISKQGLKKVRVVDYGILRKEMIIGIIKLYRKHFEKNFKELIMEQK